MTFGDYYRVHGMGNRAAFLKSHELLKKNINRMFKDSPSAEDCRELEKILNDAFYPNEKNNSYNQYSNLINDAVVKAYEAEYNKALNNFNIGQVSSSFKPADATKMAAEAHESYQHSTYIERRTIEERLNKVKNQLANIKYKRGFKEIRQDLKTLEKQLNKLLGMFTDNKATAQLKIEGNSSLLADVNAADQLYQKLSTVGGPISTTDYGNFLEIALNAMNTEAKVLSEKLEDHLINQVFLKGLTQTSGKQRTISNGSFSITQSTNIVNNTKDPKQSFINSVGITKDGKTTETAYMHLEANNGSRLTFEYIPEFNPDARRQGKMDIKLSIALGNNAPKTDFRISAKNWGSLGSKKDFGETSLAYALLRTLDNTSLSMYMYTMQDDKNYYGLLNYAHKLAKLAAIADIIMGYSQDDLFADTLVINIRNKRQVKVYAIKDIFTKLFIKFEELGNAVGLLNGYDDDKIFYDLSAVIGPIGHSQRPGKRSSTFYRLALKYMQAVKVTLYYSKLFNDAAGGIQY